MRRAIPGVVSVAAAAVVLGGCATRVASTGARARSSLPPPEVITLVPAPSHDVHPPAVRAPMPAPRAVASKGQVPMPPPPPSVELLRSRPSVASSRRDGAPHRAVPVARTGRVQPAVAAPSLPAPPVAAPSADPSRLFQDPPVAPRPRPRAPEACPGGT